MARNILMIIASAAILSACASASRDVHGYIADDLKPADVKPGKDTRATVQAQLGSPSTSSIFDKNTWMYVSSTRQRFAFYHPKVIDRTIIAIRFATFSRYSTSHATFASNIGVLLFPITL